MTKTYLVERTLQIRITEADLNPDDGELTESLALEIAQEIGDEEWVVVDEHVEELQ